jgi:hypothetical protein
MALHTLGAENELPTKEFLSDDATHGLFWLDFQHRQAFLGKSIAIGATKLL